MVSSGAGKAPNLNADKLDGIDSTGFLSKSGKAADADKLDGLSSESFTQGGGRLYSAHREGVSADDIIGTLLAIPGATTFRYQCLSSGKVVLRTDPGNLDAVTWWGTTDFQFTGWVKGEEWETGAWPLIMIHLMASRPFNRVTFEPSVLVDAWVSARWDPQTNKCSVRAVAEVFG